jgi:hypothetical protein
MLKLTAPADAKMLAKRINAIRGRILDYGSLSICAGAHKPDMLARQGERDVNFSASELRNAMSLRAHGFDGRNRRPWL